MEPRTDLDLAYEAQDMDQASNYVLGHIDDLLRRVDELETQVRMLSEIVYRLEGK